MLGVQFVEEFDLVRGLLRAVLILTSECGEAKKEERHKELDEWIACRIPERCCPETF